MQKKRKDKKKAHLNIYTQQRKTALPLGFLGIRQARLFAVAVPKLTMATLTREIRSYKVPLFIGNHGLLNNY